MKQVAREASKIAKSNVELEDEFVRDAGDDVANIRPSGPVDDAYERLTASLWVDGVGAAAVLDWILEGAGAERLVELCFAPVRAAAGLDARQRTAQASHLASKN